MFKILGRYLCFMLLVFPMLSAKSQNSSLEGEWKIETVIYEGDTLYQFGSAQYTIDAYNKLTQGWEKSKEDGDYMMKCLGLTIYRFKSMRLSFSKNKVNKNVLDPCWDHIRSSRIDHGTFTHVNDTVTLFDTNKNVRMILHYDPNVDCLHYFDSEWDYQLVYSRIVSNQSY